ncbi:MAG: hypothetical protein RI922_1946, partial [Bacteroidota bacterium]
ANQASEGLLAFASRLRTFNETRKKTHLPRSEIVFIVCDYWCDTLASLSRKIKKSSPLELDLT